MNILIIAGPRTGGFYFSSTLAKNYNLKLIHEPSRNSVDLYDLNNTCVKIIVDQYYLDDLIQLSNKFDYVFLLSRKNQIEWTQSLIALSEHNKNMFSEWSWRDYYYKTSKGIEWYQELVDKTNRAFSEVSKKLKKDIIYYEDLYYNQNSVDLQGLEFNPDTTKKLRKEKTPRLF